jgi:ABC-type dipeptide/oligopeptide/nickel transport system permease component
VIQAVVMMVAAFFVVVNLIVDLVYAWLDPRIRYQ